PGAGRPLAATGRHARALRPGLGRGGVGHGRGHRPGQPEQAGALEPGGVRPGKRPVQSARPAAGAGRPGG
ncbi:MAG: hypothetical protein D6790_22060, partial [Caldilineae bacterium]